MLEMIKEKGSLYDLNKPALDRIAKSGKPHIAEMARHFSVTHDMDRALGYSLGTVNNWVMERNGISQASDNRAREWLEKNIWEQSADAATDAEMLLVVVPPGKSEKVAKVLALLGCDVTEV